MLHRSTLELLGASVALAGMSVASVSAVALIGWNAFVPQELEAGQTVTSVVPQARIASAPVSAERAEVALTMASAVPLLVPISRPTDLVGLLGDVSGTGTGDRPQGGQDEPTLALASSPREAVGALVRQASGTVSSGADPAAGVRPPGATTPGATVPGATRPGPVADGADAGRTTVQTAPIPTVRPTTPGDRPPVAAGSVPVLSSPTSSPPAPSVPATPAPSESPSLPPVPSPTATADLTSPDVSTSSSIAEAGSGPRPSDTPVSAGG